MSLGILSEELKEVIDVRINHQSYDNQHPSHLRSYQHLVLDLATSDHLPEDKEQMTSIQCRYGDDIHKGKDDRQESAYLPESEPVPLRREKLTH